MRPRLIERGPIWDALDTIPDAGEWATAAGNCNATQTMEQMARQVNRALRMRQVVELACAIISQLQERDYPGATCLIRQYVERHFQFVRDPHQLELLRRPEFLLQRIQTRGVVQGDCDDAAQLVATLGKAVGFPAEFHAISFVPGGVPLTHVYTCLVMPNGERVDFDVTKPARYKRNPPMVYGRQIKRV